MIFKEKWFELIKLVLLVVFQLNQKIENMKLSIRIKEKSQAKPGIENLKKPYPAIFNKIAANITDPAVGAST